MKNLTRSFLILFALSQITSQALALTPEFTAYLRAGTGSNGLGGAQECFVNKGSSGNEFRLGNECGIYGEFSFGGYLLKPETETAPFFSAHSTFAFVYGNTEDFESNPATAWVPRELYVEGGRVDGQSFYLWAGKRFYRWSSIDMNDFFAIDMTGPGFGVIGGKNSWGILSAAVINNTASREFNTTNAVTTGIGQAAKTTLHVRLEEMETDFGSWSYWLAAGTTPPTKSSTGVNYQSSTGSMIGIKNTSAILGGKNEIGVAYGQGNLSNLSAKGELVQDCNTLNVSECNVQDSSRVRIWDGLAWEWDRWTGQVGIILEDWNRGRDSHVKWTSFGVRPIYWFTDHLSLMAEAGTSTVDDDSETAGARNLTRFTIAPQMSFGKGNFSRPVFRAYYSRTQWSENNKGSAVPDAPSFANLTEKESYGVQTEIWF